MNTYEDCFGKIIDVHTHVFPEKIAVKATKSVGEFYGIPMESIGSKDNLLNDMNLYGISHCFILSVATVPHQVEPINNFLADIINTDSDKFTAFGTIHVENNNMIDEIDRIRRMGILGIKLHNDFQGFPVDDPRLDEVYEKCQSEKIPLIFHAGDKRYKFTNPKMFRNIGRRFPNLIGIAAHFGGYSEWVDVDDDYCKETPFWLDTSSSLSFITDTEAKRIISARGSDKIMFGTDFPMWKGFDEIRNIEKLNLGQEITEKILYGNARNFLKFAKDSFQTA